MTATAQLDQTAIAKCDFRPEKVRLNARQRIQLRGLFGKLDVRTKSGEEGERAPRFLEELGALAKRAGGAAPLPRTPDTGFVEDLSRLTGNEQLAAILERRAEIEAAITEWTRMAERVDGRGRTWELAGALRRHADENAGPRRSPPRPDGPRAWSAGL